jgi:hypothetical protein
VTENPFDTLDQQLREAVRRRHRRRAALHRGTLALAAAIVLGAGVAAGSQLIGSHERSAAQRAIAAGRSAMLDDPACKTQRRARMPHLVADPVPADITRRLAIFRRARTAPDRLAIRRLLQFGGLNVLARSLRVARADDGTRFAMSISYGELSFHGSTVDEVGCLRATLRVALAQPQARDPRVRAEINAELGSQIRRVQDVIDGVAHILTIATIGPNGRIIEGGATELRDGKIPAFGSFGPARRHGRRFVTLSGLLPDGIYDVRIVDKAGPRRLRVRPRVVVVRDNVYHAIVPRRMGPRIAVQWRTRSGRVVRTTHVSY